MEEKVALGVDRKWESRGKQEEEEIWRGEKFREKDGEEEEGDPVGEGRRMSEGGGAHQPASRLSSLFPSFCAPPRVSFSRRLQVSDAPILPEAAAPRRRPAPQNSAPAPAGRSSSITCRAPRDHGAIIQPCELQPERTQQRRDGGYGGAARTGRSLDCAHTNAPGLLFCSIFFKSPFSELH